jgi:hypothetical protein
MPTVYRTTILTDLFNRALMEKLQGELTKAVQEAKKPTPDKGTLLEHLNSSKSLVEGVAADWALVTVLMKAVEVVQQFF